MPTLEWIGKEKVINHHQVVPFKILDKEYTFNAKNISKNMIINGDNLIALKSLLPKFQNKIDIIYIDPPYNTGTKEGKWIYSDNVDDPRIKKWLGETVGAEGEDLSRHDKWLCMMYPRLKLLHQLLNDQGVIFISIDENELFHLKMLCDEIFGSNNFGAILTVEVNPKGRKNSSFISSTNDYCLIYLKDKSKTSFVENIPKSSKDLTPDENGKLVHNSGKRVLVGENSFNNPVQSFESDKHYQIYYNNKSKDIIVEKETKLDDFNLDLINKGYERYFSHNNGTFIENTYTIDKIEELFSEGALDFKNNKIYEKNFSTTIRMKSVLVNKEYSVYDKSNKIINFKMDFKTTSAGTELKKIFGTSKVVFPNPKNVEFIKLLITLLDNPEAIVLDSFAGSATTGHAVLEQNKIDGGNRKFILIEMMDYANKITAERIKRVVKGYSDKDPVKGDFTFYKIGSPIFLDDGLLNPNVEVKYIREYIFYMETKKDIDDNKITDNPYYLGTNEITDYYFYYDIDKVTNLNYDFLSSIKKKNEVYVIYADKCTISDRDLDRLNIVFKKIPRDISKL
jgi:adenine-specific DNA-methyltransferase